MIFVTRHAHVGDRFLTVAQAAERLGMSKQWVIRLIDKRRLPADKLKAAGSRGFMYLIPRKAVERMVKNRTTTRRGRV